MFMLLSAVARKSGDVLSCAERLRVGRIQPCLQTSQVSTGEPPLEGLSQPLITILKLEELSFEGAKVGEVIRGQYFALHDGEVDLDLVQPACVDGKMHHLDVRPLALQPLDGGATAVRGTVVDDPEYPGSGSIGFVVHDQPVG